MDLSHVEVVHVYGFQSSNILQKWPLATSIITSKPLEGIMPGGTAVTEKL